MRKILSIFTDSEDSIRDSFMKQSYDCVRSHYMTILELAKRLDVEDIECYNEDKLEFDNNIKTELSSYNYSFIGNTKDTLIKYGIILHSRVTESNYDRLMQFVLSCDKLIYYNSDPEFNASSLIEEQMLIPFVYNNYGDNLSRLIKSKLTLIITGLKDQADLIRDIFKVNVFYIPQLINPAIEERTEHKFYDAFIINNSKSYKLPIETLLHSGYSVFSLVKDERAVVPGVDAHICRGSGINYMRLIDLVSSAKFYLGTNTYWGNSIEDCNRYYQTHSVSSKYFEAYYAGTFPIPAMILQNELLNYIEYINKDYSNNLIRFKNWMLKNFTIFNFNKEFDRICELLI